MARVPHDRDAPSGNAVGPETLAALYLGMGANFDPSTGPARLIYVFVP